MRGTLEAYPLSQEQDKNGHYLPLLFNPVLEVLTRAIGQEKVIRGIRIGKKKIKLSLFTDGIILYLENPKESMKKICFKKFSTEAGYSLIEIKLCTCTN